MDKKNKRLTTNILFTGIMQFCNYLVPFLIIPFISRRVGIEKMASIEYINSIVQFGIVVINYGFDFTASRRTSKNRNKYQTLNLVFNSVTIIKLTLLIIVLLSLFITIQTSDTFENVTSGIIGGALIFVGFAINPWWFYQGKENLKVVSIANAIIKILSGILIIIFIQQPDEYYLYFTLTGITQIIISLYFYIHIYKESGFRWFIPKTQYLISTIKEGFTIFIGELSILFFTYTNIIILGNNLSSNDLALYTTPNRILIIVQTLIIASFQKALYPYLSSLYKKSKTQYFNFMNRIKYLIVGIMIVGTFFTYLLREQIITILFGEEHLSSAPILAIIAFIFPFIGIANIYGWQGLLVMKKDQQLTVTTLTIGVINMILLCYVPMSPYNMAILRIIIEALLALTCYLLFSRAVKYAK